MPDPNFDAIEQAHLNALAALGGLAAQAHTVNGDAKALQEMIDFLNNAENWTRFWRSAPIRDLPMHVLEAADDIMRDMMIEAGFFYSEETDAVVTPLTSAAIIGFRHGAAYASNPENDPSHISNRDTFAEAVSEPDDETPTYANVRGRRIRLAEGVPTYVFDLLLDQAVEAMEDILTTPGPDRTDYQRGTADARLTALENVLHIDEMTPSQIIGMVISSKALNPG